MDDKTIKTVLSAVRMLVIVAGAVLCVTITSKSGADETFVEGQERYGALLDNLFYIIYAVGIACGAAAVLFGLYFFATNFKDRMGTLALSSSPDPAHPGARNMSGSEVRYLPRRDT